MAERIKRHKIPLLLVWFVLVALACTLSTDTRPPTIVPRATPTPPPTIGFATLSPDELPVVATAAPPSDTALVNLLNQVEADRLFLHIDTLQSFGTRHVNSPVNLPERGIGAAYNYIMDQFRAIQTQSQGNLFVFDHEFPLTWAGVETRQRNIVGIITGTEIGAGTIMLSAHYDSISEFPEDGSAFAPGANDNGSGVAALIEIARIMSRREHRASIMFVAFAAEEVGRVGSRAFAADYIQTQVDSLLGVLNLDIIGSQTGANGVVNDRQIRVFSAGPNDSAARHLARSINLIAFNHFPNMEVIVQDAMDREGRYGDHMSFSELGFPSVRFTEAAEEPARTNSSRDTIDDVQASYLMRATRAILAVTTALADGPRPPRNITLRETGNPVRTLVWEPIPGATSYVVALRRPDSLIFDQQIVTSDNTIQWDGFVPSRFAGVSIAALDASGLMGPFSEELPIRN